MAIPVRILIVDDEPFVRDSLAEFLEDYNFHVSRASSGEEALELLSGGEFHVAIVDLRLPGMSGDMLIVNAHKKRPAMRFLIHTGSEDYRLPAELEEIGISEAHLFYKPVTDLHLFIESIEKLLKGGAVRHD